VVNRIACFVPQQKLCTPGSPIPELNSQKQNKMFETIAVLLLLPVAVYVTVQYVRLQNKYSNAKQSLQKLEYMSELNKNIEQLARIGMWNINLEDNSVYWSDNLHRVMFGMKQRPNSWEEKTIVETVVHPDYLDLMNGNT
jgi:c-di-AMP phosphodiesterase-like protein